MVSPHLMCNPTSSLGLRMHVRKLLLVGDTCVGKSCLLQCFLDDRYTQRYKRTIIPEFGTRIVTVEGEQIKIQVWSVSGQDIFRDCTSSFFKGSVGILIVYDVANLNSFNNVPEWIKFVERQGIFCKILVGNKIDKGNRQVPREVAEKFALENKMPFIEVSAVDSTNIEVAFMQVMFDGHQMVLKNPSIFSDPHLYSLIRL